jgi:hypothetical protein
MLSESCFHILFPKEEERTAKAIEIVLAKEGSVLNGKES